MALCSLLVAQFASQPLSAPNQHRPLFSRLTIFAYSRLFTPLPTIHLTLLSAALSLPQPFPSTPTLVETGSSCRHLAVTQFALYCFCMGRPMEGALTARHPPFISVCRRPLLSIPSSINSYIFLLSSPLPSQLTVCPGT